MPLQITGALGDPDLICLPWELPLEEWPARHLVDLPRGISRHVVRFARLGGKVYAIKEISERYAKREYRLLWDLARLDAPAVEPVAYVTGRDEGLDSALITRHLQFSLPYRAVMSGTLRPDTLTRLLDALAVLLVRLHLNGFFWGDCSLSNTLFRRDAGAFAAYLVDAETGDMHPMISEGQRLHDIEIAYMNLFGEMLDLEAGGLLHPRSTRSTPPSRSPPATTGCGRRSRRTRSSRRSTGTRWRTASAASTSSASTWPR
ncbi:lipopolysaccharide kinase InaA family protein [Nonomuraea recticatena]|uniref:lipopolysaccharide kinase InaA family protein n=1 Tax=Nonomuraea recticatena TaxID=46178 RepID=UPI00360E587E